MTTSPSILDLVSAREGHFQLESGYHSGLWLDLDSLFIDPSSISGLVRNLARGISTYQPSVVCGPLVGGAFLAQLVAKELGIEFAYTQKAPSSEQAGLFHVRYELPPAYRSRMRRKKVALVDDVMSAGSSLRATHSILQEFGAIPVVVGSLMVLGSKGESFFREHGIPVEAGERREYQIWEPAHCPHCAAGIALEQTE
jgi:orotate phosphoribosyltransferase